MDVQDREPQLNGGATPTPTPTSTATPEAGPDLGAKRPSNLPLPLNSFVGRDQDLAEVASVLGRSRLLTLTGAAGIGKSRLATELAASTSGGYPDGCWLVELAPVTDPTFVPHAVAAALSLREDRGRPLIDSLTARLCDRRLLLVLDNCEHLIMGCAQLADALLRSCPSMSIVATSQEALAITGEVVWPVPPLAVPETSQGLSPDEVGAAAAVQLFCDRARATRPSFTLTPEVVPAVVDICRRLDGIALAIELAAARIDVLSPAQIASRLDDRFSLLTGGSRSAMPRQQTLRAALDWTHELLSEPERVLFRRLSVFAGGFSLDAAEEVCSGDGLNRAEVLDVLAGLVAKSLVLVDTAPLEARYRMLQTIRAYGRNRLTETGEAPAVRSRHGAWCMRMAERAEPELTGPRQQEWLERLETEHDNLRAALDWLAAGGEEEHALRLAGALTLFWRMRGHFREGRERLATVTALSVDAPPALRAKVLWGSGFLTAMLGGYGAVGHLLEESLSLYEDDGDLQGRARALLVLGNCTLFLHGRPAGLPLLEQSAALARKCGDSWCLAQALALCGSAHNVQGDVAAARPFLEEAVAVARRASDSHALAFGLSALGFAALCAGEYPVAEGVLEEALVAARELDEAYETAGVLTDLAQLSVGRGDYERANRLLAEALAIAKDTASPDGIVYPLVVLGELALAEGDYRSAHDYFKECLAVAEQAGGTVEPAIQGLAEVALAVGDKVAARALLEQAESLTRASDHKGRMARARYGLAELAHAVGDDASAVSLHQEALALRHEIRDLPGIAASLEALAGLVAADGRAPDRAVRLYAAAEALRAARGYARTAAQLRRYHHDLGRLRQALGADQYDDAWSQGATLSAEAAVSYASRGRGARSGRSTGRESLTRAEREVASLVAEGLTNRQVAERLFVSVETVKSHLAKVYAKLGVSSRTSLAREITRQAG